MYKRQSLVIGFARRFAPYKRATLLFADLDRLARIVGNAERPVIFVFSGKAHPADTQGIDMLQEVIRHMLDPRSVSYTHLGIRHEGGAYGPEPQDQ